MHVQYWKTTETNAQRRAKGWTSERRNSRWTQEGEAIRTTACCLHPPAKRKTGWMVWEVVKEAISDSRATLFKWGEGGRCSGSGHVTSVMWPICVSNCQRYFLWTNPLMKVFEQRNLVFLNFFFTSSVLKLEFDWLTNWLIAWLIDWILCTGKHFDFQREKHLTQLNLS